MTAAPASKKAKLEYNGPALELKCINTIRAVSADQPEAANSGHPGAPMGCAPMAHLLWAEVMKYSSQDPKWINRDRFVLSNGHACALQYTMLHLTGYNVSVEDLTQFRQLGSKTPGHPESFVTDGTCIQSRNQKDWRERTENCQNKCCHPANWMSPEWSRDEVSSSWQHASPHWLTHFLCCFQCLIYFN